MSPDGPERINDGTDDGINNSISQNDALLPSALGAIDGRARYREIFTAINGARGKSFPDWRKVEDAIRDTGGEGAPSGAPVNLDPFSGNIWIVAVGGYLSACMRWMAPIFGDSLAHLKNLGANTTTALVAGRSGTVHNSKIVQQTIESLPLGANDKVIVIAHSKGVIDTMEMMMGFPETAKKINALIGVTGAVAGSPVSVELPYILRKILVDGPLPACPTGDKLALSDLQPEIRKDFLAKFKMPDHIKPFSIAAWPGRDNMSTGYRFMRTMLDKYDTANDGQVTVGDSIIPGSTMLGIMNADHGAVALPFNRNNTIGAKLGSGLFRDFNAFPREVMMEAAIRFVLEEINS